MVRVGGCVDSYIVSLGEKASKEVEFNFLIGKDQYTVIHRAKGKEILSGRIAVILAVAAIALIAFAVLASKPLVFAAVGVLFLGVMVFLCSHRKNCIEFKKYLRTLGGEPTKPKRVELGHNLDKNENSQNKLTDTELLDNGEDDGYMYCR